LSLISSSVVVFPIQYKFNVEHVGAVDGAVYHYGSFVNKDGDSVCGTEAEIVASELASVYSDSSWIAMEVAKEKRRLHARVHSAGHAIDVVRLYYLMPRFSFT
jgi:hypothetical protein